MRRILACPIGMLIALVGLAPLAHGQTGIIPPVGQFQEEPPGTLVRTLEPGPGVSATLGADNAEAIAKRWQVSGRVTAEITAEDPASGLRITQKRSWLPELRAVLLETTLANRGEKAIAPSSVALGDWTFRLGEGEDFFRYRELTYRADTWYESTYWTGPDWTRVGKNWHHPGANTPAVRRFLVPRDGRISVSGRVYKFHVDKTTDGVRLAIRHNARDVWTAEISGDDAKGVEPKLSLDVRKGDAIRFVVDKRGGIACDTTAWDPTIAYADGESFQASKGFAASRQPGNPWFYEMETDGHAKVGLPSVHGFWNDGALREESLAAAHAAAWTDGDALPVAVVADGVGESGVALAILEPVPWRLTVALTNDGRLRLQMTSQEVKTMALRPGESRRLPPVYFGAYRGSWLQGVASLQRLLVSEVAGAATLRSRLAETCSARGLLYCPANPPSRGEDSRRPSGQSFELDYWAMIQADWRQQDKLAETVESYRAATARHLEKTRQLVADLRHGKPAEFLASEAKVLDRLAEQARSSGHSLPQARELYLQVRCLKRRVALANPLLDFSKLVFCKRVPTSYSHLVMQYFGWRARPGGGLFLLEQPGRSLACRDILGGKLAEGSVLEPRLSWDARRIVFSYVKVTGQEYAPEQLQNNADEGFYHVYEVNVDGSGLRQITSGPYDDLMPTYLPDGGIAFSSTRRHGYARCFGGQFSQRWHVYTLHRVEADGRDLRTLSFHDTNEWFPSVWHNGLILYSRWDYIDRDAVTHQNLWATRPDGTSPMALWGNATPSPHCTFQIQSIPNSQKIVCTASAHHSITAGSIIVVDPAVSRDGHQAIRRITPEVPFPEAETMNIPEYYESPWPLGEKYFLVGYSPVPLVWEPGANPPNAVGIHLLDAAGNRELIYRDPVITSTNPCPLVPRPMPPVVPTSIPPSAPPTGEMVVLNVHEGLGNVPRGSIKALRVVQIFPKTTHVASAPPIGLAGEENGRAILGTVPVEPDGSARFTVPAKKPLLFQALDANGFAYQTMRTITYVQPGEKVSCTGCHEPRMSAPVRPEVHAMALQRAPSPIDPGPWGGRPFSFVEVVQPVLEKHCVRCHGGDKIEGKIDLTAAPMNGFSRSYVSLCGDRDFWAGGTNPKNAAEALVPRFGARNQIQQTVPGGMYTAAGSRLIKLLRQGHHDVKLSPDEVQRLTVWIDSNAIFYGVNLPAEQARQLRGEIVAMPEVQ